MPVYNLAIVREMLSESFSIGEIDTLAFDLFPKLQTEFSGGMNKSTRIKQIVTKANQQGRIPELITYVQEENPHQYNHYKNQVIKPDSAPAAQITRWQQRQADLERHITADLKLLAEFEDALRLEDNPRRRLSYQRDIERQQASLANYQRQLDELAGEITHAETDDDISNQQLLTAIADLKQTVTSQHSATQSQLGDMEANLTAGQQAILTHIDQKHQQTINLVLARLDKNQLELVDMMLIAAEQNLISHQESADLYDQTIQILGILKEQPDGDDWQQLLAAVEEPVSLEQKLKLMLPIIPGILAYETELAVDGMGWLRESWDYLTKRIRRKQS